jgi:hypothetical protein
MTELSLKKSGRRREDYYDVLAEGGRWPYHVLLNHAGRATLDVDHRPRIRGDRTPTHGYAEAATWTGIHGKA